MTIPVLVDQIPGGLLADSAKPLRAVRRHPDEVARGDWIPAVAKPIDAATIEHEQAVLHYVTLNRRQASARLVGHRVHPEIKRHVVWNQAADLEPWIVVQVGGRG